MVIILNLCSQAPFTEEVVFRACVLATYHLARHAGAPKWPLVFLTPLSFGAAHLHHAWDTYNRLGRSSFALKRAVLQTSMSFSLLTSKIYNRCTWRAQYSSLHTPLYLDSTALFCFSVRALFFLHSPPTSGVTLWASLNSAGSSSAFRKIAFVRFSFDSNGQTRRSTHLILILRFRPHLCIRTGGCRIYLRYAVLDTHVREFVLGRRERSSDSRLL